MYVPWIEYDGRVWCLSVNQEIEGKMLKMDQVEALSPVRQEKEEEEVEE